MRVRGQRITEVLPSLVLAAVAAGYVWASYSYDTASRALPWIAGVMATTLAVIDVVSKRRRDVEREREDPAQVPNAPIQEVVVFGWIGGFLGLAVALGFYASTPLYVFCYLKLYARKSSSVSAMTAFGVLAFLYVVFDVLMGYEMFGGLIAGDSM
jgi:hypothetical protein